MDVCCGCVTGVCCVDDVCQDSHRMRKGECNVDRMRELGENDDGKRGWNNEYKIMKKDEA